MDPHEDRWPLWTKQTKRMYKRRAIQPKKNRKEKSIQPFYKSRFSVCIMQVYLFYLAMTFTSLAIGSTVDFMVMSLTPSYKALSYNYNKRQVIYPIFTNSPTATKSSIHTTSPISTISTPISITIWSGAGCKHNFFTIPVYTRH
jgi:hypothetical protein